MRMTNLNLANLGNGSTISSYKEYEAILFHYANGKNEVIYMQHSDDPVIVEVEPMDDFDLTPENIATTHAYVSTKVLSMSLKG